MNAILITGLALAGLPVLLHLILKQEPKKIVFPAFRFLKQKQLTNQRKLRLRHFVLLSLRVLLILLVALALYQPGLTGGLLPLGGQSPVAAVLIVDTRPDMGYITGERAGQSDARKEGLRSLGEPLEGPWTLLDDARFRAMEVLDQMPSSSRVALLTTADSVADWSGTVEEARKRLRDLRKPIASSQSVSRSLDIAWGLFARGEENRQPGEDPLPRLLCVFSDRTAASWEPVRREDLVTRRDKAATAGEIATLYFDVGIDKPINAGITSVEIKPQNVSAAVPAVVRVNVDAFGGREIDQSVRFRLDGETEGEVRPIKLRPGERATVEFRREGLKIGLHQAEVSLTSADALPGDNVRYLTFRIQEPRRLLAITDDVPPAFSLVSGALGTVGRTLSPASGWTKALAWFPQYQYETRTQSQPLDDLTTFEAVTLFQVSAPSAALWANLTRYVQAGGQLIVVPGGEEMQPEYWQAGFDAGLLPARFRTNGLIAVERAKVPAKKAKDESAPVETGVRLAWEAAQYQHPLLAPFREFREDPATDFVLREPRTWYYQDTDKVIPGSVLLRYADAPNPANRHPAILEKVVGGRGRVVMLTTVFDNRRDRFGSLQNDYGTTSFYLVLVNELHRYLTGDSDEANYNYIGGRAVLIRPPTDAATRPLDYRLNGPDISAKDGIVRKDEQQARFRIPMERFASAGNFTIGSTEEKRDGRFLEGFSSNIDPAESSLDRLPVEPVTELLGADSIVATGKDLKLADVLRSRGGASVDLFPFLMMGLLLFLAVENYVSNRFYRKR